MTHLPKIKYNLSSVKDIKLDRKSYIHIILTLQLVVTLLYPLLSPQQANAALTGYIRLDRLGISEQLSGTVCMQPSDSTGNESQIRVTFPTGFTIDTNQANWTVSTSNLPAGTTAWPGIAAPSAGSSISGQIVTFIGNGLHSGSTTYCFNFNGSASSTTPGSAGNNLTGSFLTRTQTTTTIDTVDYATSIVTTDADQIAVSASVPATFSFSLSANTAALGTLSTNTPSHATISATLSTNARNGWLAWVKSQNSALNSASGGTIPSPGSYGTVTSLASTDGYVLDVVPGTGTPTIDSGYDGNNADSGGFLDTQFRQIASKTTPADADTISLRIRARASNTDPAASDYSDTLTVTAAGQF